MFRRWRRALSVTHVFASTYSNRDASCRDVNPLAGESVNSVKNGLPENIREASDEALALALQGGAERAFDELVRRHQQRLYAVAYRMTFNREDALDITQEAFIKAYRKIESWKPTGSFQSWLLRLTSNEAIDHLRRSKRYGMRSAGGAARVESHPELAAPASAETDRAARGIEIEERIQGALSTLSPSQRTVFVLRHYEGMKLVEIAPVLGCSVGSVKVHLFRAMRKLRKELKDFDVR